MFSLDNFDHCVTHAIHLEQLQDILCFLFHEMEMWHSGPCYETTRFEAASDEDLCLAFYHAANKMIVRWGHLQDQLHQSRRGTRLYVNDFQMGPHSTLFSGIWTKRCPHLNWLWEPTGAPCSDCSFQNCIVIPLTILFFQSIHYKNVFSFGVGVFHTTN